MAGRYGVLVIVVALALVPPVVTPANRATLSVQGGAQYDLGDIQGMHRSLRLADSKTAQEKAGILVDDARLFARPLVGYVGSYVGCLSWTADIADKRPCKEVGSVYKVSSLFLDLQQQRAVFTNPSVFTTFLSMLLQRLNFGTFPGEALGLPGGSQFGYAPTDDSYCLFATQPYAPAPSPATLLPGMPGAPTAGSPPPGAFACVDASTKPPPTPDSFPVFCAGTTYICKETPGQPGLAPSPIGRKIQQAPVENAIADTLTAYTAIDLSIWNCVNSTTPNGTTTLGQATEAFLNALGVLAEHVLNPYSALTYEQNVINHFLSLADPLWPTALRLNRLNFSIDFSSVDTDLIDLPLLKERFRLPAPPAAPAAAPGASAAAPGTIPPATTVNPGFTGGAATSPPSPGLADTPPVTIKTPTGSGALPATTPIPRTGFDGYPDNPFNCSCQAVIGSVPNVDGNFDRNNNFSAVLTDGVPEASMAMVNEFAGQAAYIIPASNSVQGVPVTISTLSDRMQARFCCQRHLQPTYNPLATFITGNASSLAASPAATVAVFGQAFGLTTEEFTTALCIELPSGSTLESYDARSDAVNGSAQGLAVLKTNAELANLVTAGSKLLQNLITNDSSTYASYAILLDQSIAKKVLSSAPTGGRKLLQTSHATCAVDLTNSTTLASILAIAEQSAPTLSDEATTRAALNQSWTPAKVAAVGAAVANLNAYVASARDTTSVELGQCYAETTLAQQVSQLATGEMSIAAFNDKTSASAITTALTKPSTSSSSHSGLSKMDPQLGYKIACATVLLMVGYVVVIAITNALPFYMSRRNRVPAVKSPKDSAARAAAWAGLYELPRSHPVDCSDCSDWEESSPASPVPGAGSADSAAGGHGAGGLGSSRLFS